MMESTKNSLNHLRAVAMQVARVALEAFVTTSSTLVNRARRVARFSSAMVCTEAHTDRHM